MELREFIKGVLMDIDAAVDDARGSMNRDVSLSQTENNRTVEFDVAVSVESTDAASGKAGIKVLQFVEGGGSLSQETKNSTVSRIQFGVHIDSRTKGERQSEQAMYERNRLNHRQNSAI